MAIAYTSNWFATFIRERVLGQVLEVENMVLEVQLCRQLNKPPRASSFQFLVVKQVICHQMEISVSFSKEEFA